MGPRRRALRRAERPGIDRAQNSHLTPQNSHLTHARRVTGALSVVITLLGTCGVASTGGTLLDRPTVSAGWSGSADFGPEGIVPLPQAHSHNDYLQQVPLSDAIQRGFTSVEVDVWNIGQRLLVGHEVIGAAVGDRTLAELYLDPLKAWVDAHGGSVFGDRKVPFTLLVDVKSSAATTYRELDAVLARYSGMLTRFGPEGVKPAAVTVVVSGNRARAAMAGQATRWAAYDGRGADLATDARVPVALMPIVSEKWTELFRWDGVGEMPALERVRLSELVAATHAQGRRLRLYDTPAQNPQARAAVWRAELQAGVDLLNVDDLDAGQRFLLAYEATTEADADGQADTSAQAAPPRKAAPPIPAR